MLSQAPGGIMINEVTSLLDTGADDPSILPRDLEFIDPHYLLEPLGWRTYDTAGGGSTRNLIYVLEVALLDRSDNTVIGWKKTEVAIEHNNRQEPLSGNFPIIWGYTATNPGVQTLDRPPQIHIGTAKTETMRLPIAGQTGWRKSATNFRVLAARLLSFIVTCTALELLPRCRPVNDLFHGIGAFEFLCLLQDST
jgi:hypothetical protein